MFFLQLFSLILASASAIALVVGLVLLDRGHKAGDEETIFKAKRIVIASGISLGIFAIAFIVTLLLRRGPGAEIVPPGEEQVELVPGFPVSLAPTPKGTPSTVQVAGIQLGKGIIESHYPLRGQTGVPLNTAIVIVFKSPMMVSDLELASGLINPANVRIKKTFDPAGKELKNFVVTASSDGRTFIFRLPKTSRFIAKTSYTVFLAPTLRQASGALAFPLRTQTQGKATKETVDFYSWNFLTGTASDTTPPKVTSSRPKNGLPAQAGETYPRNIAAEVIFSEPVLFGGNAVSLPSGTALKLPPRIAQAPTFKSIQISGTESCGKNACREDMFCWPTPSPSQGEGKGEVNLTLKADAITDMVGNTLDGNGNGKAENSPKDDYALNFKTSSELRSGAPTIVSTVPLKGAVNVSLRDPIQILFDRLIAKPTITTSNITLNLKDFNFWLEPSDEIGIGVERTRVLINHDPFKEGTTYYPQVTSGIRDLFQNCFSPPKGP